MKQRSAKFFYWDSSVFIALLSDEKGRAENVAQILEEAESGEVYIVTSSFTLVEVIKMKGRVPIKIDDQKKVTEFFEKDYFLFVDANRKITELARKLVWENPALFPKDAVHLASAVEFAKYQDLDGIHSYDNDFLALNGKLQFQCPVVEPVPNQLTMKLGVPSQKHRKKRKPRQGTD